MRVFRTSIMSMILCVRKAIILNAISQTSRVYYALVVDCHFIYILFSSQKKFAKKVIVVIGVPHGMKVKCDLLGQKHKRNLLRRKNFFVTQEGTLYFLFDAGHGRAICCEGEVKLNASDK